MKFKSFKFPEPWVFPGHRTQTGVDVLGSAGGVVLQLPVTDIPGGSVAVPADHVLPVCAEVLGVDAQYLALCVALARHKHVTHMDAATVARRFGPGPWRLHSVGITHSDLEEIASGEINHVHNSNIKILE